MASDVTWEPGNGGAALAQTKAAAASPLETANLRRELSDFSRALRRQLEIYEWRQEQLLLRLEGAPVQVPGPLIVSLDSDRFDEQQEPQASADVEPNSQSSHEAPHLAVSHEKYEKLETWMAGSQILQPDKFQPTHQHHHHEAPRMELLELRTEAVRSLLGETGWRVLGRWIDWWLDLKEPPKNSSLARWVNSKWFEGLCAFVVVLNSVLIVYTTNYEAYHLQEHRGAWLRIVNMLFALFYSLELLLKVAVHRFFFFLGEEATWNAFDVALVVLAVLDLLFAEGVVDEESLSMTHLRIVRAMRVIKATKVLRMFRVLRYVSHLRMLLSSVLNSLVSLFWAIVLLAFMLCMFALTFVQGATLAQLSGEDLTDEARTDLQENLGSTQAGMLTLLLSTTGGEDWGGTYELIGLTGAWNRGLFLFFIAFVQLAVLNILTGVFVEHALKLAQPDHETAALEQRKEELQEAEELRRLITSMDRGKTGVISEEQFVDQLRSEQFRARLALLGLEIRQAELFFQSICADFECRQVSIEAFVSGAMRLKGNASALDLQTLTFGTKLIHESQLTFFRSVEERLDAITKQVGAAVT